MHEHYGITILHSPEPDNYSQRGVSSQITFEYDDMQEANIEVLD